MTQPHIQVEVPSQDHWQHQIKCQYVCWVDTDARGYHCLADAILIAPISGGATAATEEL